MRHLLILQIIQNRLDSFPMKKKSLIEIQNEIQTSIETPNSAGSRVKILAVSKKQSVEAITQLYQQGQNLFGENYVQEALEKMDQIKFPVAWHFIGHLQSNKVKDVVGKFELIHSVDSLKLAQKIDKRAKELKLTQKILVEVNVGQENSKSGFSMERIKTEWPQLIQLENIALHGLMCLPPQEEDPKKTEIHFQKTANLLDELKEIMKQHQIDRRERHLMNELSMGTSSDFILALKHKATIIRLGTILFGERK